MSDYCIENDFAAQKELAAQHEGRRAVSSNALLALSDRWERISQSWKGVARDRAEDAPDVAERADIRAAVYMDCAEELKLRANIEDRREHLGR